MNFLTIKWHGDCYLTGDPTPYAIPERRKIMATIIKNFPGGIPFGKTAIATLLAGVSEELLKDLPDGVQDREQALIERTLRYAEESERRIAKQRQRIEELETLTLNDPRPGLLNRRGFDRHLTLALGRARRYGEIGILAFCDLDNLKQVNDRFGHCAGDALVKCAAAVLAEAVRDIDTVGRLGGDEFGILLTNTNRRDGERRIRTIQWRLESAGTTHRGTDIPLKASIGVEPYGADDTIADLNHRADMAMYEVKRLKQSGEIFAAAE